MPNINNRQKKILLRACETYILNLIVKSQKEQTKLSLNNLKASVKKMKYLDYEDDEKFNNAIEKTLNIACAMYAELEKEKEDE